MKLTSKNPERQAYIDKVYAGVLDGDAHAYCLYTRPFLDDGTDPGPESAYEGCSENLEKDW